MVFGVAAPAQLLPHLKSVKLVARAESVRRAFREADTPRHRAAVHKDTQRVAVADEGVMVEGGRGVGDRKLDPLARGCRAAVRRVREQEGPRLAYRGAEHDAPIFPGTVEIDPEADERGVFHVARLAHGRDGEGVRVDPQHVPFAVTGRERLPVWRGHERRHGVEPRRLPREQALHADIPSRPTAPAWLRGSWALWA